MQFHWHKKKSNVYLRASASAKGWGKEVRNEDNIPIFIKPQSDYDDYIFKSLFSKRLQNDVDLKNYYKLLISVNRYT